MENTLFGKYYLIDKLATGGMAEIFRAKTIGPEGFEKVVVIKRILPHLSENTEFIKMFINEAKIAALLSHGNIVQIYELGKVQDCFYIAMEYIHGKDLKSIFTRCNQLNEKLEIEHILFIISEICKGLEYAHRKKDAHNVNLDIVHRDISPSNILISYEGEVKIVDFGIAKAASFAIDTKSGVLKGKLPYMAPEQALGFPSNKKTDIFSTGIIFYELLSGKRLFRAETDIEILDLVRKSEIIPISKINNKIPPELEAIVMKALCRNPEDRYQDADTLRSDIISYSSANNLHLKSSILSDFMHQIFGELIQEEELKLQEMPELSKVLPLKDDTRTLFSYTDEKTITYFRKKPSSYTIRKFFSIVFALVLVGLFSIYFYRNLTKSDIDPNPILRMLFPGIVEIYSNPPNAKFFIDKQLVANLSPVILKDITSNKEHHIEIVKDGYEIFSTSLFLKPGEIKKIVADLKINENEAGTISVKSNPQDAKIFLNDTDTGKKTPAKIDRISPGVQHKLLLVNENYHPYSTSFTLNPKESLSINVSLKFKSGIFYIKSNPSKADVYLNNKLMGKTPVEITKIDPLREYSLKLIKEGYTEWSRRIKLDAPRKMEFSVDLQQAFGILSINAIPWGEVYLEGNQLGITPLTGIKLPVGIHRLKIFNPSIKSQKEIEVKIESNREIKKVVDMKE